MSDSAETAETVSAVDGSTAASTSSSPVHIPAETLAKLEEYSTEYSDALLDETRRVARRRASRYASPEHVERARQNLQEGVPQAEERIATGVGGALLGGAVSTYLAMVMVGEFPALAVGASLTSGVVGAVLVVTGRFRRT